MSTHETAETHYVTIQGVKIAYHRVGRDSGIPLVMPMHFRGNMDFWDPALINALAESRPIILLDNAGIGKSEGEIALELQGWASIVVGLLDALKIGRIDLLGFSMGGGAAQHVALSAPLLVCKLILAAIRTSLTPNTVIGPRDIFLKLANWEDFKAAIAVSFFNPSPHGQLEAQRSWDRIMARKENRAPPVSVEMGKRQIEAFSKFSISHPFNPYERIRELNMPVLVANGDNDLLIPTVNSIELAQILPNAQLHIYPNSGHGFLYQYAEEFAKLIAIFLDSEERSWDEGFGAGNSKAQLA
ncbi:hypothetical protein HYALB_00002498 [Hymenoscyphus albidus]|uniref:AB hydrolase-1 domain-containing protein n=1 Tax=Hymenoscyphus albidus TaxID=595503 RepID=A0A9N9LVQ4_9HELO|nr:hypothetical protein HYALB_00002498 [Hymenoscyphus albidus]